jgi:predicted amidophosphoribosyltransferase
MGQLMLPAARRLGGEARPTLVPVPLAPARRRERGFNQADLLAQALSRLTGWTVSPILQRSRGGPALARLGRRQRQQVTAGAYGLVPGSLDRTRTPIRALVVDDVLTTGATAVACAEALDAGGAECLGLVSFARTNPLAERT